MADTPLLADPPPPSRLREVITVFLRLGFIGFGGPMAHLALIEDEVVRRRGWIGRRELLNLVAAVNFVPGPNSTELVIHLGRLRAGFKGLVAAGICFITPAVLIILPLGWLYVRYGQLPTHSPAFGAIQGIRACMIAIISAAVWRLAAATPRDPFHIGVSLLAMAAGFAVQWPALRIPQGELLILAAAALAGAIRGRLPKAPIALLAMPIGIASPLASASVGGQFIQMALFFLKVGATLFGSGYLLVSYLHGGLVDDYRWLTQGELTDAIAVGQVTPGPLLTTATFIGYLLGNRWWGPAGAVAGAVVATAAIFLPSFIFVALLGPALDRLRASPAARGALDAMNAAVVALIFVVAVGMAREQLHSSAGAGLAAGCLLVMLRWNVNATWLIGASAVVGVALPAWFS